MHFSSRKIWCLSIHCFCVSKVVVLNISKAFARVWHKALYLNSLLLVSLPTFPYSYWTIFVNPVMVLIRVYQKVPVIFCIVPDPIHSYVDDSSLEIGRMKRDINDTLKRYHNNLWRGACEEFALTLVRLIPTNVWSFIICIYAWYRY